MDMSSVVPFATTPTLAVASGRQVLAPFETTISKKNCRLFCPYADPAAMSNSAELTTTVLSECECILLYLPHDEYFRYKSEKCGDRLFASARQRGQVRAKPFIHFSTETYPCVNQFTVEYTCEHVFNFSISTRRSHETQWHGDQRGPRAGGAALERSGRPH